MDTVVVEKHGLCAALALIIAGAWTDRIDMTEIAFRLRVHFRISIYLACRSLQHTSPLLPRELEHIVGAKNASAQRPDRIPLIVSRRSRTSQIVDALDRTANLQAVTHVVLDKLKVWMVHQWSDIVECAGEEIIDTDDSVTMLNEAIAQMR